jgi:murein DD-endopeptidase MepM/ murein hydrolase activator NlpD
MERAFASRSARWYTSPVLDYTPKARRTRRRWRRAVPLLVGLLAVAGIGSLVARNPPVVPAGGVEPNPGLVGAADPSATPTEGPLSTPTTVRIVAPIPTPTPQPVAPPIAALTGYQWPLPHGRLTLPFGPSPWGSRIVDGANFHDGVDIATFCGDHVVAAHDGVVLAAGRRYDDYIGWLGDLNRYKARLDEKTLWSTLPIVVVIDDGNGYRSIYAHFSKVEVKRGATVKAGDFLGYEGMTGRASGCHVHYGLFSPFEAAAFALDPAVVKRMRLPDAQIARIDPLLVLPRRPQDQPSPSPSAGEPPVATADQRVAGDARQRFAQ